jgi:hypothetical protein
MKLLSAGLTFVNVMTVCGLLGGIASHGLNSKVAIFSAIAGLVAAFLAYWGTSYSIARKESTRAAGLETTPDSGSSRGRNQRDQNQAVVVAPASQRYRSIWLWLMVAVFAIFALRSFCNVLFIDGNELKIQNPNNLGDLSLHIAYIKNFANGVDIWPDNPIYVFSKLRYPAGVDLFNALLLCLGVDVIRGLVWVGLLASAALGYALYRWGGTFTMAGFLFNGGLVGFQIFKNWDWNDYQGVQYIGWKSLALSMLVTQRGLLYALPVGLLLLYHWRAKFFPRPAAGGAEPAPAPLPFWVELTLYATLPLFHLHTFLALSLVLAFLFLFLDSGARKRLALLVGLAFLPATFFVWLITDHFHAGSVLQWNPGWVQNNGDFARPLAAFSQQPAAVTPTVPGFFATLKHFFQFWTINFGITLPLIIALVVLLVLRTWKQKDEPAPVKIRLIAFLGAVALALAAFASSYAYFSLGYSLFVILALIPPVAFAIIIPFFASVAQRDWRQTIPITAPVAFVIPAVALFLFSCFVKTAPWEWDNIKLIIWAYLIVLPFVWSELISRWRFPIRAVVCILLFASGFVTLFGGLAAGKGGFGLADRTELDAVGIAVKQISPEARFAAFPTFNHPLLLQGRKVVMGYPGHVWTQGFNYGDDFNKLATLMNGAANWKETATTFKARYLFWGREEIKNYPQSTRPWEKDSKVVATGPWGTIYDLESPREPVPAAAAPSASITPAPVQPVTVPSPPSQ